MCVVCVCVRAYYSVNTVNIGRINRSIGVERSNNCHSNETTHKWENN